MLPALGVGLGFREPLKADVFRHRPRIDFLEITADHYLDAPPEKRGELDLLAEHFTLVPHGLRLSLGSAEGVDGEYLDKLAALIERVQPPWWSEHVAFTRAGGVEIGHLAPLPYCEEAVEVFARNVERVRRVIGAPLIVENITVTVDVDGHAMSEGTFLERVCETADCGLLLDVTNHFLSATRRRADPVEALDALPLERVVQLHFVGFEQRGEERIDSHARAMSEPLWRLLQAVLERAPVKGAILERDKDFPPFGELLAELERARKLGREAGRWT